MDFAQIMENIALFSGIDDKDLEKMALCSEFRVRSCRKGETVCRTGERLRSIGILTEGSLFIQKDCYWGNRIIINRISAGEFFGVAYALGKSEPIPYDIVAGSNSTVLFFSIDRLLTAYSDNYSCCTKLMNNLINELIRRNRSLIYKIDFMSQRSIRDKLVSYLSTQYTQHGSVEFDIPFNRQELADFLSVDRSALSNELSKMSDEGMILYRKNHFILLNCGNI